MKNPRGCSEPRRRLRLGDQCGCRSQRGRGSDRKWNTGAGESVRRGEGNPMSKAGRLRGSGYETGPVIRTWQQYHWIWGEEVVSELARAGPGRTWSRAHITVG
jgi:hypothetical protein